MGSIVHQKVAFEITYWGIMFIITCLFLGHFHQDYFNTFLFCAFWFPFTIGFTFYLNKVLIQKYLYTKRIGKFILYLIYSIIISTYIQILLIIGFFIALTDLNYENMNPIINDFSVLWFVQLFTTAMYSFLYQVREDQKKKQKIYQLEKDKLEIGYQLKELELNTLKDQIHPHFLFNTLNNIYGLAIEKSDDLPQILLQLSSLLDYLVYQSKEEKVSLNKEIKVLKEYIALEQLRLDNRLSYQFDEDKFSDTIEIIPFLLFPMVENAFKHGIKSNTDNAFLNIKIYIDNNTFYFLMSNSKPANKIKSDKKGTGLENLRKRLALCYPNQHQLIIDENEREYNIQLSIKIDNE
ncbi:histidine kinase [Flammeovirga sp. MY04]|uniref:sensor histidine kinase n=1 Tax=Flammeovirga sp. MY04 TaxID=1191459 RepID=UPI00080629A2|nr:histidine kinase [Flammeovirga sp. MY04]ANQ50390.1 histidine kinase [Flammeovirga sp. MY04]